MIKSPFCGAYKIIILGHNHLCLTFNFIIVLSILLFFRIFVILVKLLANCIFDEKIALLYILSHKLYYLSTN